MSAALDLVLAASEPQPRLSLVGMLHVLTQGLGAKQVRRVIDGESYILQAGVSGLGSYPWLIVRSTGTRDLRRLYVTPRNIKRQETSDLKVQFRDDPQEPDQVIDTAADPRDLLQRILGIYTEYLRKSKAATAAAEPGYSARQVYVASVVTKLEIPEHRRRYRIFTDFIASLPGFHAHTHTDQAVNGNLLIGVHPAHQLQLILDKAAALGVRDLVFGNKLRVDLQPLGYTGMRQYRCRPVKVTAELFSSYRDTWVVARKSMSTTAAAEPAVDRHPLYRDLLSAVPTEERYQATKRHGEPK